jgi:arylsulfatase A-like enzyme
MKILKVNGFLLLFLTVLMSMFSCSGSKKQKKSGQKPVRPNIIFFIADDMHRDMFNCLPEGKGKNLTPNLDKLSGEGVLMLNQYVSSSVCTPSRYSCLTGQYASRAVNHAFDTTTKAMDGETVVQWNSYIVPGQNTIGKLLKKLGYVTGFFGKNHAVEAPGWQKLPLDTDPTSPEAVKVLKRNARIISESLKKCGFDYSGALYQDNPSYLGPEKLRVQNLDWVVDEALKFLDKTKDSTIFLYFATTVPHGPSNASQSWNGDRRVTAEGILDEPPHVLPDKSTIPERLIKAGLATKDNIPDDRANNLWIDDALGALLNKLKEQGKLDNTIIFFFNDHGTYAKGSLYQGGISTPSIIWKSGGFNTGNVNRALVSNIDFAPTILDMAGGDPQKVKSFDGTSFLPLLEGKTDKIHNSLYFEMGFSRAVLKDSLKYIALRYPQFAMNWTYEQRKEALDKWNNFRIKNKLRYHFTDPNMPFSHLMLIPGGGDAEFPSTQRYKHYYDTDQLYDLRIDPEEQDNLIKNPAYQDRLDDLKHELKEYLDKLPGKFGEFKTK